MCVHYISDIATKTVKYTGNVLAWTKVEALGPNWGVVPPMYISHRKHVKDGKEFQAHLNLDLNTIGYQLQTITTVTLRVLRLKAY